MPFTDLTVLAIMNRLEQILTPSDIDRLQKEGYSLADIESAAFNSYPEVEVVTCSSPELY